jgi:hypothetical protein
MRMLLCLLALVAAPAWAEWVKVAESDDATVYVDPATIRQDGDLRTVSTLQDLKERGKNGEMSRRALEAHDCKEPRYRTLSYSLYPEPMSGGQLILTNDYMSRWAVNVPDTPPWDITRFVCYR